MNNFTIKMLTIFLLTFSCFAEDGINNPSKKFSTLTLDDDKRKERQQSELEMTNHAEIYLATVKELQKKGLVSGFINNLKINLGVAHVDLIGEDSNSLKLYLDLKDHGRNEQDIRQFKIVGVKVNPDRQNYYCDVSEISINCN